MNSEVQASRAMRAQLRAEYKNLYDGLAALFFRHDPMGIAFEDNTDEYEPEVGTILPRLRNCSSEAECLKVIHEEFCRWFGEDQTGSAENYETIAHEIWIMWNEESLN